MASGKLLAIVLALFISLPLAAAETVKLPGRKLTALPDLAPLLERFGEVRVSAGRQPRNRGYRVIPASRTRRARGTPPPRDVWSRRSFVMRGM